MTQSKPQNPPKKHHYIPEFYQRKWTTEGKLVVYQNHNRRIHARRKSPGATGYAEFGYAMEGLPPQEAQMIETEYMIPVDDKAALARDALLARRQLTRTERGAWVQFIMSLWLRTPEELLLFKNSFRHQFEIYKPQLDAQYLKKRSIQDPSTYDDYLSNIGLGGRQKEMMRLFLSMMTNERLAKSINDMFWIALDTSTSSYKLMTSDRPVVQPYGLGRADAYIAIPISPDTLFVAMRDEQLIMNQMARRGFSGVVCDINAAVVGQSYKFVYAFDESQARFVNNRMSKLPRWSLIERMTQKFRRDEAAQADHIIDWFNI